MAYEIVEWQQRYEVNTRSEAARSGDPLYKRPLDYYRSKANGTRQGMGYRKLLAIAGRDALEVFGIFHKLMEIAASQPRNRRGVIRESVSELSYIIGVDEGRIEKALSVLCDNDLRWLTQLSESSEDSESCPTFGKLGKIPKVPPNETKRNETERKRTKRKEDDTCELLPAVEDIPQAPPADIYFVFAKKSFSSSVRLVSFEWYEVVRPLLILKNKGDITCLGDIQHWLTEQIEDGYYNIRIFDNVWQWAVDARTGEVPMKVFQARLKKELAYECKSKRISTG